MKLLVYLARQQSTYNGFERLTLIALGQSCKKIQSRVWLDTIYYVTKVKIEKREFPSKEVGKISEMIFCKVSRDIEGLKAPRSLI